MCVTSVDAVIFMCVCVCVCGLQINVENTKD